MASAEAVKRMETRAAAAEQLIAVLKGQIDEIQRVTQSTPSYSQEIEMLKTENSQLKAEILTWKSKLVQAEVGHNVPQIPVKGK